MPPETIKGVEYVDGALGDTGGIPIDGAQLDGYDRFFVVCTRPRGYVKNEVKRPQALRRLSDAVLASPRQPSHDQPSTTLPVSCCATSSQTGRPTSSIHASCP